jgi:hypothetical protein
MFFMMLAKIEVWFSRRNVQNAIAKTRPKYFGLIAGQHSECYKVHCGICSMC